MTERTHSNAIPEKAETTNRLVDKIHSALKTTVLVPVLVFFIIVVLLFGLSGRFETENRKEVTDKTNLAAEQIGHRLEDRIETYMSLMHYLRNEWKRDRPQSSREFESRLQAFTEEFPGYQAVNYIDPEGIIRWVVPEKYNLEARDKNLHLHPQAAAYFIKAERTRKDVATPPLTLLQGGYGFATYFPLVRNQTLEGYLNGVFRIDDFIAYCLEETDQKFFYLIIRDGGETVYQSPDFNENEVQQEMYQHQMRVLDRSWDVFLVPRQELITSIHPFPQKLFLWTGIILSLGLAVLLRRLMLRRVELHASLDKLSLSEQKYRELFEKTDDAILIIEDNKFIDCNQATVRMLRYSQKSELLDTHPSELSPERQPDGRLSHEKADEMMDIAYEKGSHRFEWAHKRADGEVFPVEVLLTAVQVTEEKRLLHTVWRDITDRKQSEILHDVTYEISKATNTTNDLQDLFKAIHFHLSKIIDTTNLFIGILEDDDRVMSFPYYVDEYDDPPGPIILPRKFISEHVLKIGQPLYFSESDIRELAEVGIIDLDLSGTIPLVWLGSPLEVNEKLIGLIAVQSYHDPNLYSRSDLDILNFVSEQVAIAIQRKRSQDALNIEKTSLEALIEHSPFAIAILEDGSRIQRINKAFTDLFGFGEECIGMNIDRLITNPAVRDEAQQMTREITTGGTVDLETIRIRKDGRPVFVSILGTPVRFEDGRQVVYAIYRDISDRKEAENLQSVMYDIAQAARSSNNIHSMYKSIHQSLSRVINTENFYIAHYDESQDSITFAYAVDKSQSTAVEKMNQQTGLIRYMLGLRKPLSLTRQQTNDLIRQGTIEAPDSIPELWLGVPLLIGKKAVGALVVKSYSNPELYSDKDIRVLEFVSTQIAEAMNFSLAQNALKRSEANYKTLSANLTESNSLKELLLDIISHDLKNPAGVVSGAVQILADEQPENELIQLIKESNDNLLKVIENATTLSRVIVGDEIGRQNIDLVKIVRDISKEFKALAKTEKIVIEYEMPESLIIRANPIISEIPKNFLSNAIKYGTDGNRIICRIEKLAKTVRLSVADFGKTIPKEIGLRVFERKFQLENAPSMARGQGLGLSIVKRIADSHGARVGVLPNTPNGNIFYVEFPG